MNGTDENAGRFKPIETLEKRVLFSALPPVVAPSNLVASAINSTTVELRWSDNSSNEDRFEIWRATSSTAFELAVAATAGATRWLDSSVEAHTQYFYAIRAVSGSDASDFSSTVAVTTPSSSNVQIINQTLFIRSSAADDLISVTETPTPTGTLVADTMNVTFNGLPSTFNRMLIRRVTILSTIRDHALSIDDYGTLFVRGNLGNDVVGVSATTDTFTVDINGSSTSFSRSLVKRITILTYDGDDRISIGATVGGVNVSGGVGNDSIFGNAGDDRLDGGAGDDLIKGNDGNDNIKGGDGNDTLYGQGGNDYLQGGNGDDKLVESAGRNLLDGGLGNDRIYAVLGFDTAIGGGGRDLIRIE